LRRLAPRAGSSTDAAARLRHVESEIDQEQAMQFGAAAVGFIGAILSLTVSSGFVLLPAFAVATLGQYLVQGWCPPLALLARLGLRSSAEIDGERYALAAALDESRVPQLSQTLGAEAD
jgi:hypothetical protein